MPRSKPKPVLTPKQQRFVAEYLKDLNGTQAAIRAGYSAKTAAQQAERLLKHQAVKAAVAAGETRQLAKLEITAERVKEEIARLAFFDPGAFFDDDGAVKPMSALTLGERACIAQLDVIMANVDAGDGKRDRMHRIKLADKMRALELLAKHFGIAKEQVEVTGLSELVERLTRARQRVEPKS